MDTNVCFIITINTVIWHRLITAIFWRRQESTFVLMSINVSHLYMWLILNWNLHAYILNSNL